MKNLINNLGDARFAAILFVVLFATTVFITPTRFSFENIGTTIGLMMPFILAACAATPIILAGREGIDLSIGPLMGIISVLVIKWLVLDLGYKSPLAILPFALAIGVLAGALNGFLAVYIRIQPIVATLGSYLMLAGLASWILPAPEGPAPSWLISLSEDYSFLPFIVFAAFWLYIKNIPLHGMIITIGGDDRAAYSSGINVNLVRFLAYLISGAIAALAAISLTALLGSADAQAGPNYTLLAIAAAALGGVSLAGGKGSMTGATLGAIDIFLLQNLITHFNVSSFFLQITYGLVLVIAVSLNSERISQYFSSRKGGSHV